uniref:Otogelin like n=1 Tax=Leptobrachium leishanense TaxID=445787 RepID=A0A8C5PZ85_9ANUR
KGATPASLRVPNAGKNRDEICKSWGQYNFETFDGIYFYFPGNCSYVFARDCSEIVPLYTIWVHNSPQCNESVYTCPRSISMFFSSHEEITVSGYEVRKAGVRLSLPQTIENVFIERLADYILVKTTFGFSLAWDGGSGVYIKLSEDHKGKVCGLCGNFNGNWSDDLIMQHRELTEDIAMFGNSWHVQTLEEPICVSTSSDYPSPCCHVPTHEAMFVKCQVLLHFPFLSCHETIDPYSYIASCMNDLCKQDDEETYCRAVTEYARACAHSGFPIRDWRDDFPACSEKCEDNFVHRDCISCCPPTCTYEKECLGSNLHCLDGCYCPDGLILDNGTCVSVTSCPCIYHGTAYPVGSKIEQECSMCVCAGGIWNCTEHECPAECSVVGDSHFTTFDGRYFTFLGTCQYILVKGIGKDKFTITLQKALCDQNFDHACVQSITLVFDEDLNKQVTILRDGDVHFGSNQGLVMIRNLSSMFVQLKTKFGIRIQFAKGGDRLYIQASSSWKRRTLGLCGTFNGNLRDDFLSPAGMIEGTAQLHANAWKISSACFTPINIPVVDPCDINLQNVGYAIYCDVINQELFAPCHSYVSPGLYYQLCRFDACKCGSSCLCNALAHYAYICNKHGVNIPFRSRVSFCGVICRYGMLYHQCTSYCGRTCSSLSAGEVCSDECVEGCNCPDGKYFDETLNFCVTISNCRCYYRGRIFHPGESNLHDLPLFYFKGHSCPEGKIYFDCRNPMSGLPSTGVNCEVTCANLAMNFTCVPSPPCSSGCICPPGMAEHKGKCYVPDSCPCTWKDWEYLSGEVISTPCYTCICRRGIFNCTSYPCPSVCTVYGDRHYHTFDGLEYDYVSDCQVYLVKSADNSNVSIVAQNRKCFDNDIICSKNLVISLGDTEINFIETSDKQKQLRFQQRTYRYQHWKAGFYSVVHVPELEITVLWDKKTTIHVKVGPRWKGKLSGLCGNFDKYTSNDLTTSNNMEVRNAQIFGDSWTIGQCKSFNDTIRPCEVHQNKFPYAKKECSILYSDIFAPCRNVIDVTSFVKNCHTDTCNCNLGGDCECLCTSIAAYAHKCCQQGVAVHWRSQNMCPYDCEYFNQGLGEGPYILSSCGNSEIVLGVNVTSKYIYPLPRISAHGNVLFNFMITPGLYKDKDLSLSLVSLESAERPNYFLSVQENDTVQLEQWDSSPSFRRRATFFHHQGLWIAGFSAFELHSKKGYFITLTATEVKVSKYDSSEEFKFSSGFKIEEIIAAVPYRRICEWRYEPCSSPCVKTCGDPEALLCTFLPPVEGCMPYCPNHMILDEITLKCVYPEDCVPVKPTDIPVATKPFKISPVVTMSYTKMTTKAKLTTIADLFPFPRYFEPLDPCSQYVCINMGWMLYNVSSNCHKNVEKPDCGFRGMPVQVNSDSCCPEWECPCQCSVLSELSIITFDGNNIALYNAAPYILVRLPRETIVAHIEKCPPSLVAAGGTSGLCFKKLNVTTADFEVLINRLDRKVEVNSINQPLPFSKQGLCIQDTGAMYVINTPAGLSIKWTHVTGIIDIQYGLHSNISTKTEGLCGICNGDPSDDLKMQNRTIITNKEDIEAFIKSWEIEKSIDVTTRRPVRNCTEDNCTYCMELLNRKVFAPCHRKVAPQDFCEKMWINNTYFLNYECDALSAYVALCNKHHICIRWRTKEYCSLTCPEGKEYQACVQPCAAKTCLNKWYYEESHCSHLREDCVCKKGTILHRTDSELCIPEEKCACTDNEGNPRSPGEVWNSSVKRCCMFRCLENGSVLAIEPVCGQQPVPLCDQKGETLVSIYEEGTCCPRKLCECNMSLCEKTVTCKAGEKLVADYSPGTCCPKYRCGEYLPFLDKLITSIKTEQDGSVRCYNNVRNFNNDLFYTYVVCESCTEPVPVCSDGEILTVDLNTTHQCCPRYLCVCDEKLCATPQLNCTADTELVKKKSPEKCCSDWSCVMAILLNIFLRTDIEHQSTCGCTHYVCEKEDVCVFQESTILYPGQSLIQYLDGELCYTVQCLHEKDPASGFHAMDISTLNCSKQCAPNQVYISSSNHQMCCGSCINVSCIFHNDNGTQAVYEAGSTWISNCTRFECTKTAAGAMILGSSVTCPPFNGSECLKNGGTIQTYNDGCCKICKFSINLCYLIRFSISFLVSQITVASCDGKCPSATIFNVNLDSHIRFCKCCRENGVQNLTVPLYCSGNGTQVMYVIQEPLDCSCQWN